MIHKSMIKCKFLTEKKTFEKADLRRKLEKR